jgi:antitoxin (DNA-binding transcriptional repressor) of toxin-antitoxin stability system
MKTVTVSQARNTLPRLLDQILASHQPVLVVRYGKPVAQIAPADSEQDADLYPLRKVRIEMDSDFNAPMPELWSANRP